VADALADTLERRGKLAEAVMLRRQSLGLTEKRYASGHRLTAWRQVLLARGLLARGGAEPEAAALLDQAISALEPLPAEAALLAQARSLKGRLPPAR
jgi:hypothetical protein